MDTLSQLQRYISLIPHPCGQNIFVCAESEIFFIRAVLVLALRPQYIRKIEQGQKRATIPKLAAITINKK